MKLGPYSKAFIGNINLRIDTFSVMYVLMRRLRIVFILGLFSHFDAWSISIEENLIKSFVENEVKRFEMCVQSQSVQNADLREFRERLVLVLKSAVGSEAFRVKKKYDVLCIPGIADEFKKVAETFSDDQSSSQYKIPVECYIRDLEAESGFYRKFKVDHGVYILNQYVPLTSAQRAGLESSGYCVGRELEQLVLWASNIINTHVGSILPFILDSEVRSVFEPEQNEMVHLLGRSSASSGIQLFLPTPNFDEVFLTYHVSSIIPKGGVDQVDGLYFDIIDQLFSTYAALWQKEFGLSEDWRRRFELAGLQSYRQFAFRMSDPEARLHDSGTGRVFDIGMPFTHVLISQPLWRKMVEKSSASLAGNEAGIVNSPSHEFDEYMALCGRMNIYQVLYDQVLAGDGDLAAHFISGRQLVQLYEVFAGKLASGDLINPVGGFPDSRLQDELRMSCQTEVEKILSREPGDFPDGGY